jgi:translation elongation factor EF-1beta
MKNDVMPSIIQMDAEELQQLTAEIRETVATGIQLPETKEKKKSFGIVDMWNIRRTAKSASSMLRR